MRRIRTAFNCLGCALIVTAVVYARARADERGLPEAAQQQINFARDIQPIFAARCYDCHGPEAHEGGLRLSRGQDALAGGDNGPVFAAGKSAESKLIKLVAGLGENGKRMPPQDEGEPLSQEQISLLRAWIDQGAQWPQTADVATVAKSDHWAFQPVLRPRPPSVKHGEWLRDPIDAFVLARLESEGIEPSPEADRPTHL
jgi:mono/diheme cytochrome c family protein